MTTASMKCMLAWLALSMSTALTAAEHTMDSLTTVQENLKAKKAVLRDVREVDERSEGHLSQAALHPLSKIEAGLTAEKLEKLAPKGKDTRHCI